MFNRDWTYQAGNCCALEGSTKLWLSASPGNGMVGKDMRSNNEVLGNGSRWNLGCEAILGSRFCPPHCPLASRRMTSLPAEMRELQPAPLQPFEPVVNYSKSSEGRAASVPENSLLS
ncbi:hypothetical protein Ancab_026814 [Ancistrocladus abbreviatus]